MEGSNEQEENGFNISTKQRARGEADFTTFREIYPYPDHKDEELEHYVHIIAVIEAACCSGRTGSLVPSHYKGSGDIVVS